MAKYIEWHFENGKIVKSPPFGFSAKRQYALQQAYGGVKFVRIVYD